MKKKTTIIGIVAVIFAVAMLAFAAVAGTPADIKANSTTAQYEINNNLSGETINSISKPCGVVAAREPDPNFHTS